MDMLKIFTKITMTKITNKYPQGVAPEGVARQAARQEPACATAAVEETSQRWAPRAHPPPRPAGGLSGSQPLRPATGITNRIG